MDHLDEFGHDKHSAPPAPPSESSQDSENSADFVKIESADLRGLVPDNLLHDFGRQVAQDVLGSALRDDNLRMDERDLYVPKDAAQAEAHALGSQPVNLDEFDPLMEHHNLQPVPESKDEVLDRHNNEQVQIVELSDDVPVPKPVEHDLPAPAPQPSPAKEPEPELVQPAPALEPEPIKISAPEPVPPKEPSPAPVPEPLPVVEPPPVRDPSPEPSPIPEPAPRSPTPVDNVDEEIIPLKKVSLLTQDEPGSNDVVDQIRDAVQDTHDQVSDLLSHLGGPTHEQPVAEQPSPSGDSGKDVVAELSKDLFGHREEYQGGMRDHSPDLTTYERDGPLTFPTQATYPAEPVQPEPEPQPAPVAPAAPVVEPTPEPTFEDFKKEESAEPEPAAPVAMSKTGLLFRAVGSLISLVTRITFNLVHYASLLLSVGVTVFTVGEYTHKFVKDKPQVVEILKWRDPRKSAAALALSLLALILIAKFSVISLIAWTSLAVLAGTLGFRVYKLAEAQLKKTDGGNPFKPYLESEIAVPQEKAHAQADLLVQYGQNAVSTLRKLFLVENVFESIKFGVLLWTLTYIGAWFSGIALATIFVLSLFSVPKIYELYQGPIDEYIALAKDNVNKVNTLVQEKLPFLKAAEKEVKTE